MAGGHARRVLHGGGEAGGRRAGDGGRAAAPSHRPPGPAGDGPTDAEASRSPTRVPGTSADASGAPPPEDPRRGLTPGREVTRPQMVGVSSTIGL
ncbi:hypothetical protein GCM10010249_08640 [Streptomyces roseolilacinus]|uniref:Uncharacterized protein n=1 Tax=Streptomyces roseolilacinus TaxID=66904 RepID=A0A918EJU7_9ACTN|nr:hypothetical protein GCM10010249_08640 [Streptomyces roseolilacinus]